MPAQLKKLNNYNKPFWRFILSPKRLAFLAIAAIVFTGYTVVSLQKNAYAATGINRTINFQGKVVNKDGTNVTDGQYTFVFKLYDASSGGANPWTETQNNVQVTAGIFRVSLGSVTTFASAGVDFNTDNLYLAINFNSDGEMTPRVRFAAVPYAINAETVAGLTVTSTTGTLTIPNSKVVQFGGAFTTSAQDLTLTLGGATNVTLPTTGTLATLGGTENLSNKTFTSTVTISGVTTDITTGTNEALTLAPNGTGNVLVQSGSGGQAALIVDKTGLGDIFSASSSGVTRFVIQSDGTASSSAGFTINGAGNIQSTQNQSLTIGGGSTGELTIGRTSQKVWLPGFDCSGSGNGGKLTTTSGGVLTCAADGGGSSGDNFWQYNSSTGIVANGNLTTDLLLGGTSTQSAKFAVLGIAGTTVPTASVSAQNGSGQALALSGDGSIQSLRNNTLTIGGSTTGNISLAPLNGSGFVEITSGDLRLSPKASVASTTEGTIYYDSDDDQLKVYANGKWQADRTTATVIVGTSNGAGASKNYEKADFVCGASDCDTTIESAIAALPAAGGVVALLEGIYTVDVNGIDITTSNVTLIGTGKATVIQRSGAFAGATIIVGDGGGTSVSNVTIADLTVDGNSLGITNVHFNQAVSNSVLRDSLIKNGSDGILIAGSGSVGNIVQGNTFENSNGDTIHVSSGTETVITGNKITSGFSCIFLTTGTKSVVSNNQCASSANGIELSGNSTGNTFVGNVIQASTTYGFYIFSSSNNTISGNTIISSAGQGISLQSGSNSNTVTGNNINEIGTSTKYGIHVTASDNNIISSNRIIDSTCTGSCYGIGIVDSTSDNNYMATNEITGAGFIGKVLDSGTGTTIQNRDIFEVEGNSVGKALLTLNQTSLQDILAASSSGVTKFVIKNDGTASASAGFTIDGNNGVIQSTQNQSLTIGGGTTGELTIGRASQKVWLPGFDCSGSGNGGKLTTTSGGVLTCAADGGGSSGDNFWQYNSSTGIVANGNLTTDLLLGGTSTQSAKFAFTGVAGASTPIASISATTASGGNGNGIVINANGSIQSLRNNTLNLGGSTTGEISLQGGTGFKGSNVNTLRTISNATNDWNAGFYSKAVQTGGGGANTVDMGIIGQVDVTSGTNNHAVGVFGYASGTSSTARTWIGTEGRSESNKAGDTTYGVYGLSVLNTADNTLTTAVGNIGSVQAGTAISVKAINAIGLWGQIDTTGVGGEPGVYNFNGLFGNDVTNYPTVFRGQINSAQANASLSISDSTDKFILDLSNAIQGDSSKGVASGFNIKFNDAAGTSNFNITTNGDVERFRIDSLGKLGLGTASPLSALHITRPLTFGATGKALAIFDQIENQDILTASSGGTTKFTIKNDGTATTSGNLVLDSTGSLQTTKNQTLTIGGTSTGSIVLSPINGAGTLRFTNFTTNGGILYTNGAGVLAQTGAGSALQCLLGNLTWGTCSTGTTTSPFYETAGAIVPFNGTEDFLIGAQASTSAKFAVLNVTAPGGTVPTASVSSGLNGTAASIDASGNIRTANKMPLTLGGGNTGNITIQGNNTLYLVDQAIRLNGVNPTFSANGSSTLTLNNNSTGNIQFFSASNTLTNAGALTIAGSATINGGTVQLANGSQGTIQTTSNADIVITAGSGTINLNTISNGAVLTGSGLTTLGGGLTVNGATTTFGNASPIITTGTNTDLTITPNGTGNLIITSDFNTGVRIGSSSNPPALLSVSGGIGSNAGFILNRVGSTDDIFAASSSGTTKFVIKNDGNASSSAGFTINGTGALQSTNNQTLTIGGSSTGNIVLSPNNGSGNLRFSNFSTANGLLYTNGSGVLAQTGAGGGTQCLYGNLTWGACTSGSSSPFQELTGAIVPNNSTLDFLIGAQASTSAKFAVTGIAAGTNPSASVSATTGGNTGNGIVIAGNGSIQSLQNNTLTLGGDSTGNISLMPKSGSGYVGIGTASPTNLLHLTGTLATPSLRLGSTTPGFHWDIGRDNAITGDFLFNNANGGATSERMRITIGGNVGIGTASPISALHITRPLSFGATGKALAIFDQIENQDILTASASGTTRFVIDQNGLTTITPIGSGASKGLYVNGSDSTTAGGGGMTGVNSTLTLTGNKPGGVSYGYYGNTTSNSTTTESIYGIYLSSNLSGARTTAGPSLNYGIYANPQSTGASTGNTNTAGGYFVPSVTNATTGSVNNVYGIYTSTTGTLTTGGTISQYGAYIDNGTSSTTGTSTKYGLYVAAQTGAGTNYSAYFGNRVGIGISTPTSQLQVNSGVSDANATLILNQAGLSASDIFAASASGTTKFVIKNDGTASSSAGFTINGAGNIQSTNNQTLTIGGSSTGFINIDSSSGQINLFDNTNINGTLTGLTGLTLASGAITLGGTTGATTQCLTGGATASWTTCSTGFGSPFKESLGAIMQLNTTEDFLAGGQASTSAAFKVTGQGNPFAGTAVGASVSANTSFAGLVADNRGAGDIFTASSAGMTRFTIRNNGNVGIGTNLPGDKLEIKGIGGTSAYIGTNVSGLATIMGLQLNSTLPLNGQSYAVEQDTAHTYLNAPLNGNLYFRYGNTDRNIMLGSSGNFGLGTIAPISALHVTHPLTSGANGKALAIFDQIENQDIFSASVSGATKFVLNNKGQIGLNAGQNNSSPLATLDVRANLTIGGTLPVASISGKTSFAALTVDNSGLGDLFTASSSGLNRFVITQNGNVGIGTSQPSQLFAMAGGNFLQTASTNFSIKKSFSISEGNPYGVAASGKYVYVVGQGAGGYLDVIDISNVNSPIKIGTVSISSIPNRVVVSGNYAYVAAWDAGLQIVDVSTPKAPKIVGSFDPGAFEELGIAVVNKIAYLAHGTDLRVVDVSNPTSPVQIGILGASAGGYNQGVYVSGKYAYVAEGNAGLKIVDISDPTKPRPIGNYNTAGYAYDVYVSGTYAYVADNSGGLLVIDVSNPSSPTLASSYTGITHAEGIKVAGDYAYVADTTSGLVVVNISDPTSISLVGSLSGINAVDVSLNGKYAYLPDNSGSTLKIVDINGIQTPSLYAGNILTNQLNVSENGIFGNQLYVQNGLNIGFGGIFSQGAINVNTATGSANLIQGAPVGRALFSLNYQGTDQNILTASTSGVTKFAVGNDGQVLFGNAAADPGTALGSGSVYYNTASQALKFYNGSTWSSIGTGNSTSPFKEALGAIIANQPTEDFLLGGNATSSAEFAVLNLNSGTPTASVSATSTGKGISLAGDGTIQSLRNNTLAVGGNTTGDISFLPGNASTPSLFLQTGGNVGLGTANPLAQLHISGTGPSIYIANAGESISTKYFLAPGNDNYMTGTQTGDSGIALHAGIGGFTIGTTNVRLKFTNSGNLGIGTLSSPTGVDAAARLQVYSSLGTNPAASISARSTATPVLLVTSDDGNNGDLFVASVSGQPKFRIDSSGGIHNNGGLSNDYGDFAEYYKKANIGEVFEAGQLVCLEGIGVVKCSNNSSSQRILGIISDRSFLRGNASHANDPNYVLVGMVGQLGVWVNGDVKAGDPLTFSSTPGIATAAKGEANIIGYAQEGNNNALKRVDSVIQPTYFNPNTALQNDNVFNSLTLGIQNGVYTVFDAFGNSINHIDAFSKAMIGSLQAGFASIQTLAVNTFTATTSSLGDATARTFAVAANTITIGGQDIRQFIIDTVRNAGFGQGTVVSPIATNTVKTNVLSPLADNSSVQLNANKDNFELKNTDTGKTVAWFNSQGNATISGQLTSDGIQTSNATVSGTLAANTVVSNVATVSGTLTAGTIIANNISGLDQKLATLAAAIQNNPSSSNSGQTTNNYLASDTVHANFGIFEQGITSMGPVTSNIITATDQLAVGNGFTITNNAINTVGADLQIQSLRQGDIAFEGGLIKMDTDGNMLVSGNLNLLGEIDAVHGVFSGTLTAPALATGLISPLPGDDLAIKLSDSASTSGRLKIINNQNQEVLSINSHGDLNASGSGTFAKLNFNLVGKAEATSLTEAVATGSAGFATLKQGQVELTIKNQIITSKSLIYITPFGDTENKVIYLLRQVPQSEVDDGSFTVGISGTPSPKDIQFNWLVVN